jgi:hypothetical protein
MPTVERSFKARTKQKVINTIIPIPIKGSGSGDTDYQDSEF